MPNKIFISPTSSQERPSVYCKKMMQPETCTVTPNAKESRRRRREFPDWVRWARFRRDSSGQKINQNCAPHRSKLIRIQDSKRLSPKLSPKSLTRDNLGLLLTCVILLFAASTCSNGQQQEPQLPTVIVRGFLNYRTTVDGTVLLFTPDAGQQQQQPSASMAQPAATSMANIDQTAISQAPSRSLVYTETLAQPVEPTSVLTTTLTLATGLSQMVHTDSNSFRHQNQQQQAPVQSQPPSPPPIAAGSPVAQPNDWRPIQATPPLKMVATLQSSSSSQPTSGRAGQEIAPAGQPKPSVQADDISDSQQASARSKSGGETQPSAQSVSDTPPTGPQRGPRRPSLGFSGQGLRPRVPGTAGAVSPSLQSRSRTTDGASTPNSINGIRRPGLASSSSANPTAPARSQQQQPASTDPVVLANVSSAFQNRLSNASTRLKNRFKHRQPYQTAAATSSSPTSSTAGEGQQNQAGTGSLPKQNNNLIAPESLLDVASSIEQPTSAARSLALVPQSNRNSLGSSEPSSLNPVVGSDEIVPGQLVASMQSQDSSQTAPASSPIANYNQEQGSVVPVVSSVLDADSSLGLEPMSAAQQAGTAALSRAGEQSPRSSGDLPDGLDGQQPKVLSGQLQQGSLSSGPLNLDALFMSDQPSSASGPSGENQASSEPAPSHVARPAGLSKHAKPLHNNSSSNLNGKLNGWLGQHHNKFVPRPSTKPHNHTEANLSQHLAANLQQLAPTSPPTTSQQQQQLASSSNDVSSTNSSSITEPEALNATTTAESSPEQQMSMQTVTRTYSTILETSRTRLVPMQVKSSTGVFTITEDYIMTKMMTAYQTLPAMAEFILADQQQLSTRAPYEIFEQAAPSESESKIKSESVSAPGSVAAPAISPGPVETQEQPISLDESPKSANNWLHDFSNLDGPNSNPLSNDFTNSANQQQTMLAMLEQQARDANLAATFPLMAPNGEPLDQLASQLDPSSLLADGAINIPDLNNPLVLAAAIQNPQLAAVILAAQQLKLKRQQQQKPLLNQQQQQLQQLHQLQPSYSTSYSTTVRPSTYTARDTMYTTRLVSFRDGRTVRTRTVSEPGSVVEQVLTTIVTETIPVTVTIKPTGVIGAGSPATALPNGGGASLVGAQSNQATINNALFATQLANILARRQQQLQTSFNNPVLMNQAGAGGNQLGLSQSATPQQLLALQQFIGQQQKRQQPLTQQAQQQQQQQFQPNFQQLLQSMDSSNSSASNQVPRRAGASSSIQSDQQQAQHQATPLLQQAPKSVVSSASPVLTMGGPLTTTLTSLQIRTYTVHNAFKTIFRTITSTVLIPTVLNAGSTMMPGFG